MSQPTIRILGIAPYRFLPAINGGHKAIEQLYKNLGSLTPTIVVSTQNNEEKFTEHYRLIRLFSNGFLHYLNIFNFISVKSLIKTNSITHIMIEHPYMGWLGFLLQRYAGVSFVVRSHNIEAMRFKTLGKWWWKAMWRYERWVYKKAELNFFITEEDRDFAIHNYRLLSRKCEVLTYGINMHSIPSAAAKKEAKQQICTQHRIPVTHRILLFAGDYGYAPNCLAVEAIIQQINPVLLKHSSFAYRILICGRNLPGHYVQQIKTEANNILYAGFVTDIVPYFLAADIFINPVIAGGGIKTKLVEAIGYNCNTVSTFSGAGGVHSAYTKNKLVIVEDCDWKGFVEAIFSSELTADTPAAFYDFFYWGNIAGRALNILEHI